MGSRTARIFVGLGISTSAILVTLLLLEVFFRLFFPQSQYALALAPWGFTHKPNAKIHYRWRGHKVPIRYNSKGLRGPEFDYEKPSGIFRILFLGDSFAEDMGSFYENLFSTRLEKKLNRLYKSPRFEVINAGHFAFDNAQELMFYLEEGRKYHPDVVVVLYAEDRASSRFATVEDGALRLHYRDFSRAQHISRAVVTWVRSHSHFGSFVLNRVRDLKVSRELAARLRIRLTREATQVRKKSLKKTAPASAANQRPVAKRPPKVKPQEKPALGDQLPEMPLAIFPPDHPNVANLPKEVKEELIQKGVIRSKTKGPRLVDWLVWAHFGKQVEKDGARLVIFSIFRDSSPLPADELRRMKIAFYNLDLTSEWISNPYEKAAAEGTYDPRLDSHRWGYGGNEVVAEQMLKYLLQAGFLPPGRPDRRRPNLIE